MSQVKPDFDPANLYFITITAVNRANLFHPEEHKQIIVDSLDYMRRNKWFELYSFVIMPNHIYLLVRFLVPYKLQDVMRDFKKFTAKRIIRHCEAENNLELLSYFEASTRSKSGQKYQVWEKGYDARDVFSIRFLEQKLEYIHNNPCQPQWGLVESAEDYRWSSACFHLLDKPAIIQIDDLREFLIS